MDGVWILTSEYNDYDQHGEYFEGVWQDKPNAEQLMDKGVAEPNLRHVLNGGGRIDSEYKWFNLVRYSLKK